MPLQVAELSLELIETLRPLVPRIKARDQSLADQINRRARFFSAAGSAGETYTAVRGTIAWRYFTTKEGEAAAALLKRIIAILWKLSRC